MPERDEKVALARVVTKAGSWIEVAADCAPTLSGKIILDVTEIVERRRRRSLRSASTFAGSCSTASIRSARLSASEESMRRAEMVSCTSSSSTSSNCAAKPILNVLSVAASKSASVVSTDIVMVTVGLRAPPGKSGGFGVGGGRGFGNEGRGDGGGTGGGGEGAAKARRAAVVPTMSVMFSRSAAESDEMCAALSRCCAMLLKRSSCAVMVTSTW